MTSEHSLLAVGTCPVDGTKDVYEIRVTVNRTLPVEEILAAVERLTAGAAFQEDITEALARELAAHVWTRGNHSGVTTVCSAGEAG